MNRTHPPDSTGRPNRDDLGGEDLRTLFQELPRKTAPGEDCPSPDTLWAAAQGELDPTRTRHVILHTGRCPSCAEDWRIARHMARDLAGEEPIDEPVPASERSRNPWLPRWLPAAAAVMVALLGAGALLWRQPGKEPVFRNEPREAIESLVAEDQPLSRDAPTLRWSGPEGAIYSVVVTTQRVRIVAHEQRLTETEFTLPDSVVATLDPGTVLFWHVKAVLPDGSRVRSRTFRVEIH